MENEFYELPVQGKVEIQPEELALVKAQNFTSFLLFGAAHLIQCYRVTASDNSVFAPGDEIIVLDLSVDASQNVIRDIRYTERLAIHFTTKDETIPFVFALRTDFPEVPHRLHMPFEKPFCLCIYEQDYEELKLEWRSQKFLDDIRNWLVLTSEGKLHQADQPLEQLLYFSGGMIALPHDIQNHESAYVYLVNYKGNRVNLIADYTPNSESEYQYLFIKGEVQEHGQIKTAPEDLIQMHELLLAAQVDLRKALEGSLLQDLNDIKKLARKLLLVVQLPKTNADGSNVEHELHCFLIMDSLESIGISLGLVLTTPDGKPGHCYPMDTIDRKKAKNVQVFSLIPTFQLSKENARAYSNSRDLLASGNIRFTQIGVGALGSQIFMNMAKSGLGHWKLIDEDILLPHNLVRHQLGRSNVMQPKAVALSTAANDLLNDTGFSSGLWENYLAPLEEAQTNAALQQTDIILDISTSIPVERSLANRLDLTARKISSFLNPAGTDLVMLIEDTERIFRLDVLEFQYYRELIQNPLLFDHLSQGNGKIRYAKSCRALTAAIPGEYVSIHASIASAILKNIDQAKHASIHIWQLSQEDLTVSKRSVPIMPYHSIHSEGWEIVIDSFVIDKIGNARLNKLPLETGGILIGGYDFVWKKIYIVDTLLSPADSEEKPTSYVRGIEGVAQYLNEVDQRTAGHLKYIGEWHSHPKGCALDMSEDDLSLFAEIKEYMNNAGYPPLMVIAGDDSSFQIYTE